MTSHFMFIEIPAYLYHYNMKSFEDFNVWCHGIHPRTVSMIWYTIIKSYTRVSVTIMQCDVLDMINYILKKKNAIIFEKGSKGIV